jgi:hypothetical protein
MSSARVLRMSVWSGPDCGSRGEYWTAERHGWTKERGPGHHGPAPGLAPDIRNPDEAQGSSENRRRDGPGTRASNRRDGGGAALSMRASGESGSRCRRRDDPRWTNRVAKYPRPLWHPPEPEQLRSATRHAPDRSLRHPSPVRIQVVGRCVESSTPAESGTLPVVDVVRSDEYASVWGGDNKTLTNGDDPDKPVRVLVPPKVSERPRSRLEAHEDPCRRRQPLARYQQRR